MREPAEAALFSASRSGAKSRVVSNETRRMNAPIRRIDSARLSGIAVGSAIAVIIMRCPVVCSVSAAGDHEGFVVEPEAAALAQHLAGGIEIAPVAHDGGETVVLH